MGREDGVSILNIGFGIGDKVADAKYVPLVHSGQMHPLSLHLYTKKY
jgi:hypothetical protein